MNPVSFYQRHLDQVSRSFSFCIARLEGDLRLWVSLSYLLCRLLDTVEDAPWDDLGVKRKSFQQFQDFLKIPPSLAEVQAWSAGLPKNLPEGELLLLKDAFEVFQDFHALPDKVRQKIQRGVQNMARGMVHFTRDRELRLKTLAEVNQYCFFVAGVVGEILTDLLKEKTPLPPPKNIYVLAHHFGLFLQKINLLKDQAGDEKEGRYLVPSRPELLKSLATDAKGALEYLQSIPLSAKGYRLFCAWSLFLGLISLPWIHNSWTKKILEKIPRAVTEKMLSEVEAMIDDNQALERFFHQHISSNDKAPALVRTAGASADLAWFRAIYEGPLNASQIHELGLV
jgi:phytoene/squalene synthetase